VQEFLMGGSWSMMSASWEPSSIPAAFCATPSQWARRRAVHGQLSNIIPAVQLQLSSRETLLLTQPSRHASVALHPILVSRPSQLQCKRSSAVSMLQSQDLQARSSTARDETNKSCGYWMRHMHDAWQQKQQQPQPQPQESKEQLTLVSR
jgi:hypothetical protein